jgi:predicted transcriptional regulator of viral defense system
MKIRNQRDFLFDYVEALQSKGCYWFIRQEMNENLAIGKQALAKAISRLIQKGKIIRLYRDFYIIIPAEYKKAGVLPPTWFIAPLTQYMDMKESYYVGLLSAAALFGAGHQKTQEFQVLVLKTLRPIIHEKLRIKFINKMKVKITPTTKIKTDTGYINVSIPEATALDLVQYMGACGSLGNVATTLLELSERLDAKRLLSTAIQGDYEFPVIQRLGYILEFLGKTMLVQNLLNIVKEKKPKFVNLRPDLKRGSSEKNENWRIIKNDVIEVDL